MPARSERIISGMRGRVAPSGGMIRGAYPRILVFQVKHHQAGDLLKLLNDVLAKKASLDKIRPALVILAKSREYTHAPVPVPRTYLPYIKRKTLTCVD